MPTDYGYFEETKLGRPYDLKLLRRLYPYTRPYALILFGSIGLVLLMTALDLALPYVTKVAIDRYIVPPKEATGLQDNSSEIESEDRFVHADLTDPRHRAIVKKHPGLFKIEGNNALISYADISRLKKSELAELRKKVPPIIRHTQTLESPLIKKE